MITWIVIPTLAIIAAFTVLMIVAAFMAAGQRRVDREHARKRAMVVREGHRKLRGRLSGEPLAPGTIERLYLYIEIERTARKLEATGMRAA